MSSTNRGRERNLDDFYVTQPQLTQRITETIDSKFKFKNSKSTTIIDLGCGTGNFLDACKKTWSNAKIIGIEKNLELAKEAHRRGHDIIISDAINEAVNIDDAIVIGNPPYNQADQFILKWLPHCRLIIFLLRLNFLGGKKRYDNLWSKYPASYIWVLPRRPSFTPDGRTDSIEYAIFVWERNHSGSTELRHLE